MFKVKQQQIIIVTTKKQREMKVITDVKELDKAINELRENVESKTYFRFYLIGEQTIREAVEKYNLIIRYWRGLNGLFSEADRNVQGLSLSGSELEFVPVAIIEGLTDSNCLFVDSIFNVVQYKDYLLKPLKYSSDKTYHFEFLQNPIKITVRTNKPNKVSVLTDKKADAWVAALLEDIRKANLPNKRQRQEKGGL